MYRSSIENHKKIAAFLEAAAKHLEPSKIVEVGKKADGTHLNIAKREIVISPSILDSGDLI